MGEKLNTWIKMERGGIERFPLILVMNAFDWNAGVDGAENAAVGGGFPARVWPLLMVKEEADKKGAWSWKFEILEVLGRTERPYLMQGPLF